MRNLERKREIRKRILDLRKKHKGEERAWKTDAVTELIRKHPWFLEAKAVYCYMDFGGEVGTRKLIEEAWRLKKQVYVPLVSGDTMEFYKITSFSELVPGAFGILEPTAAASDADDADAQELDCKKLMIVPGVAFDKRKNRIGFGKGYYDRYLALHPEIHTIAAAYAFQIVDTIEAEETDIRMEMIATENGIF